MASKNQWIEAIPHGVEDLMLRYMNSGSNGVIRQRIKKELVHKQIDRNVTISPPILVDEKDQLYRSLVIPDFRHEFFFDHPLQHLPGILIIEASRQCGTAISHMFFDVPFGHQFILNELDSVFMGEAEKDADLFIDVVIFNKKYKPDGLRRMTGLGYVHQNGKLISKILSSWAIIPDGVLKRLGKFH